MTVADLEVLTMRVGAFFLPLIVFWNTFDEFVMPKLLLARLIVLVLGGLRIYRLAHGNAPFVRPTPVNLPLFAFVISAALSTVLAVNRNVAIFGTYMRYEGALTIAVYAALFYLVATALRDQRDALTLIRVLAAGAYAAAVIAIFQTLLASPFVPPTSGETELTFGGVVRAAGTFGNASALAALLAMLIPFTAGEALASGPGGRRLIAANEAAIMSLALVLTFSRGAWVAAAVGLVIMAAFRRRQISRVWLIAAAAAIALTVVLLLPSGAGLAVGQSVLARLMSLASPTSGSMATRLHIWHDTLALIASRPLTGYGPDTFGLVYPKFQTGYWTPRFLIDKAHADTLQIAATQGILGVAAYIWTLAAFVTAFLRGSRELGAGAFGGFVAYQLQLQLNFSYVPAATSFWLFAAASILIWTARADAHVQPAVHPPSRWIRTAVLPVILAMAVLAVPAAIFPYVADMKYRDALADVARGDGAAAKADIDMARSFAPTEGAYAAAAGDLALRLQGDTVGPDPDWTRARSEYDDAVSLGTYLPSVYRHLAIVDQHLGRRDDAIAAAKMAVELNPYDPVNQTILDRVEPRGR